MKFLIYSDLHLETGPYIPASPEEVEYDAVILAGDIHDLGAKSNPHPHIEWMQKHFTSKGKPVYYVFGNHEYYGGQFPGIMDKVKRVAESDAMIYILDNEVVVLEDNGVEGGSKLLLAGTTLWTDYNLFGNAPIAEMDAAQSWGGMADYKYIRQGKEYRKLRPDHLARAHEEAKSFFTRVLHGTNDLDRVIAVTHHAPSRLSVPEKYKFDSLTPCYASNLEHLFGGPLKLWVHGHTHSQFDYTLGGTRIVCNPRGYYQSFENFDFNDRFVVEV